MKPEQQTEYIVGCIREGGSMHEDDARQFLAEHDDYVRAEVLAEAKIEVIAWLMAKAAEDAWWDLGVLASKIDRGAVRIFLGAKSYRDVMVEHRAQGLREAAAFVDNDDDCGCGGCDSCIPRKFAADLRRMADEAGESS